MGVYDGLVNYPSWLHLVQYALTYIGLRIGTRLLKMARNLTWVVIYGIRTDLKILICQVVEGGNTKADDIIPQWTEFRRWGHEASRHYLTREVGSWTYGLSVQS